MGTYSASMLVTDGTLETELMLSEVGIPTVYLQSKVTKDGLNYYFGDNFKIHRIQDFVQAIKASNIEHNFSYMSVSEYGDTEEWGNMFVDIHSKGRLDGKTTNWYRLVCNGIETGEV